ncbi:programmed cell death protein 1 [Sceloporus undulatus]|uniref:programmed cell death protein 1 n=1 Tax=Sceloporus undulatus TaxID=8520 RepID=UPI001C4D111D|nr:programmed cell death protein 1 [Sceloporus undulatus]
MTMGTLQFCPCCCLVHTAEKNVPRPPQLTCQQATKWPVEGVDVLATEYLEPGSWGLMCEATPEQPDPSFLEVTMENRPLGMALAGSWLLLLCCRSALLLKPSATFRPTQLSQPVGTTAEFHCNISVDVSDSSMNWFKLGADRQPRILDTSNRNKKYQITCLSSKMSKMAILKLEKNDSGTYFCTFTSFSLNQTLTESDRGILTVTEFAPKTELPEEEEEEDQDHNDEKTNENTDHKIRLVAIGVCGLLLVLILGSLCFFLNNVSQRRQGRRKFHDENAPLEAEPPAVAVFTVDYGVLEFQARQNVRRPPLCPPSPKQQTEQTEYATIVFPPEKPDPVNTEKRTKRQGRCATSRAHPH